MAQRSTRPVTYADAAACPRAFFASLLGRPRGAALARRGRALLDEAQRPLRDGCVGRPGGSGPDGPRE
eukprot:11202349-Lingulodinium_polyedra.AAC.1